MKKLLTGSLLTLTAIASSFSYAQNLVQSYNFDAENLRTDYRNTMKVKNLVSAKSYILDYLEKKYQNDFTGINDIQTKNVFDGKMDAIKSELSNKFDEIKFERHKVKYEIYLGQIKDILSSYKDIKSEFIQIKNGGQNPYIISTDETNKINGKVVDIQKAIIADIQDQMMNILSYSGIQETGNMNFNLNSNYGKAVISFTDYNSKVDFDKGSQEFSTKLKVSFDLNLPEMGAQSGSISLDLSMIMTGQDMYITINDYSSDIQNPEINQMAQMISLIKGKPMHIANPQANEGSQAFNMKGQNGLILLKNALDTLNSNSLFTPFKKTSDGYKLIFNLDTIKKLASEYMANDDYLKMNSTILLHEPINYTDSKGVYVSINDKTTTGEFAMNKDSTNGFIVTGKLSGTGENTKKSMNLLWQKDIFKFNVQTYEGINFNIDWVNNKLDMMMDLMGNTISITGDYSKKLADLKITYNSNNMGYMKSSFDGKKGDFDMYLNLDVLKNISEYLKSLEIKYTGNVTLSTGSVQINIPENAMEMDQLMGNM